ncbi:MAG: hypothetical protein GYA57_22160 [Myxococcales bacterium]|nr:hypothetical protein [Myxococcales bacterium]
MRILLLPRSAVWVDAARDALTAAGIDVETVGTPAEAARASSAGDAALVADASLANLADVVALVRGSDRTETLPLVVVVRDPMRDPLERTFRLGIDDYVVESAVHQLRERAIALLRGDPWAGMRAPRGRLVLADPDRGRRQAVARVLRAWGFDFAFAADAEELAEQLRRDPPPRLAIAAADLPPDGAAAALPRLRGVRPGVEIPWLLLADAERLPEVQDLARAYGPASVFDRSGPPENIIFLVNDLLQARGAEARRSPRLLHGGPVSFWTEGSAETFWAYSYNINRTGLYVRTLAPPPLDTVLQVRFRPPFGEGLVAAEAQVMWRKEYGTQSGPLHPPGIGIQFTRVPLADAAAHAAGYDALLAEHERAAGAGSGSLRPEPRTTPPITGR